jgi:hypothetical protein
MNWYKSLRYLHEGLHLEWQWFMERPNYVFCIGLIKLVSMDMQFQTVQQFFKLRTTIGFINQLTTRTGLKGLDCYFWKSAFYGFASKNIMHDHTFTVKINYAICKIKYDISSKII